MSGKTAIVAGATGLIGGFLLRHLIADPRYARIVALTRRPLDGVASPKLENLIADFDALEQSIANKNLAVDDAYCALGTTIKIAGSQAAFRKVDHDYILAFAQAAKALGAKRFLLVSAIGADAKSQIFYSRVKGETEQAVGALGFAALHIFRPGMLIGSRAEKRPVEEIGAIAAPFLNALMLGPARPYRSIEAETVAKAMVAAASNEIPGRQIHTYDEMERLAGV
ncbi:Male sterility domain [Parvibaculum lavamentivorans DS-1]|uniref:Male sterility domain n=1 Tax=Parvibaculum lavamentivorans (strain DS-1 / DSM 13023 / NCIMB 13966) TaxID=402881 RepID=A7HRE5_PARL1|nr:oxidoreductase [Parvibaculum lavamentivorans]ABS62478.1 Male sterility domain [Parvibaculum lavamentivorans DS-1]